MMKTTLALIVVLTAGACSKTQPVTTVLPVEGMTCGSCEQAIQAEVKRLEGVQSVRASHKEKKVWVTYRPDRFDLKQAVQTINRLGYRASMSQDVKTR